MFLQACFAVQRLAAHFPEMSLWQKRKRKKKMDVGTQTLKLVRILLMNVYMKDLELYILQTQKPGK